MDFDNRTRKRPLSVKVIQTVADAENASPTELGPLDAVLDADALDRVFRGRNHGSVTFGYRGYTITAQNGVVILQKPPPDPQRNSVEDDDGTGTYETSFDRDSETASMALVSAVATVAGVQPTELPPLYSAVDPGALESLATPGESRQANRTVVVSFRFDDYPVAVNSDGAITVQQSQAIRNSPIGTHGID